MNGGTFTPGQEKERAGIYFRFTSAAQKRISVGERGTVAIPLELSWGESKKFIEINDEDDVKKKLGLDIKDPSLLLLREVKKKSKTVKLYKVNDGTPAKASLGDDITATAICGGTKGNDLLIRISSNVLDETKKDVTTYLFNQVVDKQTVSKAEDLNKNAFVIFEGKGELTNHAGLKLSGGDDGKVTNLDYTDFLAAAEKEYFDVIGLPVDGEEQLKTAFVSFIKRIRDQQGIKVVGVLPNYAADHEGVINVTNGVVLEDGHVLEPAEAVAWVAGASAGASMNQSLTFVQYEGAIDVSERLDNDEIIDRLNKGEFLFTFDPRDKTVSVEKDINSFVSFTSEKFKKFSKNKIIRILDAINNDLTRELKEEIKDRKERGIDIPVNDDGIQIINTLSAIYLKELQSGGAIKNFDAENDILIEVTDDDDGFNIKLYAQPVDAGEKYYVGVEVR
ncbi:phage tail sheath family protein [Heyndrickxia sp. NPDC080065]|uniref:phage tail sheath family protein n=1 Tax=Heyndrickxia sp. NPDC080065 TaxID=3390568 RepID=UPI003D00A514